MKNLIKYFKMMWLYYVLGTILAIGLGYYAALNSACTRQDGADFLGRPNPVCPEQISITQQEAQFWASLTPTPPASQP